MKTVWIYVNTSK
jgi:hypothetical protein